MGDGAREEASEEATMASAKVLSVIPVRLSMICALFEPDTAPGDLRGVEWIGMGVDLCKSWAALLWCSNIEFCSPSAGDTKVDFVEVASSEPPKVNLSGDWDSVVTNGKYSREVSNLGLVA